MQVGAGFLSASLDDVERRVAHRRGHDLAQTGNDSGLFSGDLRDRVPENLGVLKVDWRNHRHVFACHRVCGVEPAAEHLVCPCHGSEYSNTGEILKGPTLEPLRRLPVVVEGETIVIELPPTSSGW